MNYKSILASWFGLGLLMFLFSYPFQYLFMLLGMARMNVLATALAGLTSAMILTYSVYPHIMSPLFKIYAMITSFCLSMIVALAIILSNSVLRSTMSEMIQSIFQRADMRMTILSIGLMIVGLFIQFAAWYLFITLGNKQMLRALEAKK